MTGIKDQLRNQEESPEIVELMALGNQCGQEERGLCSRAMPGQGEGAGGAGVTVLASLFSSPIFQRSGGGFPRRKPGCPDMPGRASRKRSWGRAADSAEAMVLL
jgi:hypothetical protein